MSTISKQEGAGPHLVTDVKTAANGHWPEVLASLGVVVPPRKQHGPCPVCGGRDRFRFDDKGGDGRWICGQGGCDKAGDGLDLVVRVTGQPVAQAARLVAGRWGFPMLP
ncbi:primase-helicase zinc-binding domain-containing protein [Aeromonas caviae]